MSKTVIYFMPGLAASPKIFENLSLPTDQYELYYLTWLKPLSIKESLANYAKRLCKEIKHSNIVLIGVSFGGIVIQEMSKYVDVKKLIIISSIKSYNEFSNNFRFAKKLKAYSLFPTKVISNFDKFKYFFIGKYLKKKAKLYETYLSERDELYLNWSIRNVLLWKQEYPIEGLVHIQGTKDPIFPVKKIKNYIAIKGGTHAMILLRAKKISKIIQTTLTDKNTII